MTQPAEKVELKPETLLAYTTHISAAEAAIESENCTYIECLAISLPQDVPSALAWIIDPRILNLSGESLKATLEATRRDLSLPVAQV